MGSLAGRANDPLFHCFTAAVKALLVLHIAACCWRANGKAGAFLACQGIAGYLLRQVLPQGEMEWNMAEWGREG